MDYFSNERAKVKPNVVGHDQKLKNNERYGTVRTLKFSLDTGVAAGTSAQQANSAIANQAPMLIGDRFDIGSIPQFSRVVEIEMTYGAMGGGAVLSIGTDAVTFLTTQPDFGQGTGTEIVNAQSVAAASTGVSLIPMAQPTLQAAVPPDSTGVGAGYGFENKTGRVHLFATAGGANFAAGKHIEGTIYFIADTD